MAQSYSSSSNRHAEADSFFDNWTLAAGVPIEKSSSLPVLSEELAKSVPKLRKRTEGLSAEFALDSRFPLLVSLALKGRFNSPQERCTQKTNKERIYNGILYFSEISFKACYPLLPPFIVS